MNRVLVITTEGCEGCEIMKCIVSNAYLEAKIENTSFGYYDFQENEVESIVNENNIKDFPTTLLIKDNKVVDKILGSCTKEEVINKIRSYFVDVE